MDKRNVLSALALGVGIAALLKKDSSVVPSTNPNARTGEEEGNKIINNTYGADFYKGANRILATDLGLNTSKVDNYSVLMSAIDRAAEGDEIYLPNGTFNLKQQIDIEKAGVRLVLAKNAVLNFNPTNDVDQAIRIKGFDNRINGGRINVNDKVENAIFLQGNGSRNRLIDIVMESTVRIAGQRAIYAKATPPDEATYFNRLQNLDIIQFGEGIYLDTESNATFVDNVTFTRSLTGIHIVPETVMCMISNVLFQGHFAPTGDEFGIRCYGDSNVFSNIVVEIIQGAGIKFEAGANFNNVNGLVNTQAAQPYIDLGADNNIQSGDNLKAKYLTMNQHAVGNVKNGSLFVDTADNRLKFKFYDGTTRVISWT
jgi:hypothetical protein